MKKKSMENIAGVTINKMKSVRNVNVTQNESQLNGKNMINDFLIQ